MPAPSNSVTLRFLGAGGAFSRRFGTTCSVLELPHAGRWLIDCGRQAPEQLHDVGISWHSLAGLLVTHVHGDHIYGVEELAFTRFFYRREGIESVYAGGPRPKLICHGAVRQELWESLAASLRYVPGPAPPRSGTLDRYFEVVAPSRREPPRDNPWSHAELFEIPGLTVLARETVHVPGKPSTSFEFRVGTGDRMAWWSGDSTVDAELLTRLEPRATVFFHDCTFVESPGQVHGSFALLEALPERVRRKVVLMHHEDDLEENRSRAEALGFRIALPGDVYDLGSGKRVA